MMFLIYFFIFMSLPLVPTILKKHVFPQAVHVGTPFFKRVDDLILGWKFLFWGREMVQKAVLDGRNGIISVQMPGTRIHLVSSLQHYNDLNNAHTSQLSLHEAALKLLQPRYTMQGFSWPSRRDVEGVVFVRCVRNISQQLDRLIPTYISMVNDELELFFKCHRRNDKTSAKIPLFSMTRRLATKLNNCFLFGAEIAGDGKFNESCDRYISQTFATAELVNLLPEFLGPIIFRLINGRDLDRAFVWKVLSKLIKKSVARRDSDEELKLHEHEHMVDALVNTCPSEWTIERILCEINTVMVPPGAGIAVIAAQAVQDLTLHPEFIAPLRDEITQHALENTSDLNNLHLLECFLMESTRVNCFEVGTGRRVALQPFTFSGGHRVELGEWVSYNQKLALHSGSVFKDPENFVPYRFMQGGENSEIRFTDINKDWPIWGVKKLPCPGRYQADAAIKIILAAILTQWNIELDDVGRTNMEWRLMKVPSPHTALVARKR